MCSTPTTIHECILGKIVEERKKSAKAVSFFSFSRPLLLSIENEEMYDMGISLAHHAAY